MAIWGISIETGCTHNYFGIVAISSTNAAYGSTPSLSTISTNQTYLSRRSLLAWHCHNYTPFVPGSSESVMFCTCVCPSSIFACSTSLLAGRCEVCMHGRGKLRVSTLHSKLLSLAKKKSRAMMHAPLRCARSCLEGSLWIHGTVLRTLSGMHQNRRHLIFF